MPNRIREVRKRRGWTQSDLAERCSVSPQVVSNWERGYSTPDAEDVSRAASALDVSVDYLLGRANVVSETRSTYATNTSTRKAEAVGYSPEDFIPVTEYKQIPIVAEIPCGVPVITQDNVIGYFPVVPEMAPNGGEYIWVRAKGDSMTNARIRDGALVLIRLQPEVENGEIAAVCVDNENATLKRVLITDDQVILVAENDNYKPMYYHKSRIRIVGKATKIVTDL
jgi:repressor LexA